MPSNRSASRLNSWRTPQGKDDQGLSALVGGGEAAPLQLLYRLAQAEALKQRPPSAPARPDHRVPLVGL